MKKNIHSRAACFLLVLILLMQNLAIPVHANDDGTDIRCTVNADGQHTPVPYEDVPTTCTTWGYSGGSYCSACNAVINPRNEYPPYEHKEKQNLGAVAPTCTQKGRKEGVVCTICGITLSGLEEIPATGHNKVVTTEAKSATCTEDGCTEGWYCSVEGCGYTEGSEVIPATGHTKEVTTQAKAPTCGEAGCTEGWKCKVCGHEEASQVIPTTGHTEAIDAAVPATCTTPGKTEGSHCSVCNTVLVAQTKTPLADHTPAIDEAVPATCTTPGKTAGSHCAVCNTVLVAQTETPLADHTPAIDEAVPATCTTPGKTEGSHCSVCGVILTPQAEIPATGHTEAIDAGVPAACTTPGKTEGTHCSVCGETLKAQEHIPAKGHYAVIFPGYAPTCEEIGKENGLRCFTCGAVLEPRPEIPATGHQLVPVNDNPDNGFTCQVCGKTWAGLTQDGSYPLLPYEKEDNANGFRLSNGEAPAKSAHLQVYRNEEGNYVNVICLTWEDGTKSYVAFETGTANIGELLTIYLQNAKPAATRAKLEDASQPNFGVGFDESGNPFLYVVKDGTKYAFMVSTPVVETVEIVFGTKDLTTTEETQPIQKFEEMKEEQNTPDIEKDTSDNTFDNTFYIHKFVDPDAEKEKVPEVIIPEAKMKANFEPLGDADHPGEDPNGHSETKHKEALTYVNDNCHKCGWCGALVTHKGVQNGVFTCCGGKCSHSEWDASLEKCICYHCGKTKEHNFVEKELGCECADCGVYYTKHDCTNTTCSRCGHTHSWNKEAGVLICSSCGLQEAHGWENNNGSCRCVICGKTQSHDYKDGLCTRCGYQCSHSWRDRNGVNICYNCQMTEVHDWQERDGGCWCTNCGKTQSHDYKDGFCTRCKARCTHPGGMSNGTCAVCGYTCSHDFGWSKKNGDVCVCKKCRMEEAHHWRRFGGYYICSKCGAFSIKKKF